MLDLGLFSRSRIRPVRQTEVTECGLASLTMVANFYGYNTDLGTMRRRFVPSLRGTTLRSLIAVADQIGLMPRAVKLTPEKLGNLHLPAILHWDMNHYVVLERIKRNKALIHNPKGISAWVSIASLSRHFTGVALELRPSHDFDSEKRQEKLKLSELWKNLNGLKRAIAQIFVLTLCLQLFIMVSPYYMQIAVDSALPALDNDLLTVLAIGFGIFTIFNFLATLLRSFIILIAGTTLGFSIASNISRKMFRLPVDWFEKRHVGDILSRFQSVTPIQNILTQGAVAALVDGVLAILTMFLMFWYSPVLAIVALIAFLLYAAVRILSYSFERDAQEAAIIARGKEQSMLIETLHGIATLRLFGKETFRHAMWQSRLIDAVNAGVRVSRIGIWQTTLNVLVFGLENIISIWLAIGIIMAGEGFSLGMLFAYMAYKTQFIQKSTALVDQFISFNMIRLHLERLSDIALSEEDVSFKYQEVHGSTLRGEIELKDIFYRYSPTDPFILKCVNFKVMPGEHVAITGLSGGGKSTLVKLLLGLLEPDSGQIFVDGIPLRQFGYKNYRDQVAAVMQDDNLFSGSLLDNIALFSENVDMDRIHAVSIAAAIHEDILAMPMQYETMVGDMGSTLSGGQKQRVLLARALYREPRVLVMDEGTAHLDTACENAVNMAIGGMGITRIIIAHRRETVDAAKRVLIMEDGKLRPQN